MELKLKPLNLHKPQHYYIGRDKDVWLYISDMNINLDLMAYGFKKKLWVICYEKFQLIQVQIKHVIIA